MRATPAIRLEGGLFSPDILEALEQGSLKGQKPQDFGLEPRRNLTDEIAAAFADARDQWALFQRRLERLPEDDPATTATRDAWVIPFLGLLGYELAYNPKAYEVDGLTFAVSHRASGAAVDGPPVHVVGARQELGRVAPSGRPRLSPHALVQEYLNRTEHLWGLVTNGLTLRLLRDSTFVRRQAYVEFDLTAILEEQRFGDFALLYRLLHRTRLPKALDDAESCLLETYYTQSVEQGGRVRDKLRDGVEACLQILANGFLSHGANLELRRRVDPACTAPDRIRPEELYRQLLRLVYRFLFLLVSEERGLISPDPLYRDHYGILRLRRLLDSRAFGDDHDDLWHSLRLLWKVFRDERFAALLEVAPLNGDLFKNLDLDACALKNRDLLEAFRCLAEYRESPSAPPRRVNYAALDVEELGSVYESLLEYHPRIESEGPSRARFVLIFGSERKTTGSYYTPPELVAELVKSALEPVLEGRLRGAKNHEEKKRAILSLRVCDPACGSGHFLLAAARRLGKELARATTGEDEPSPEALRSAIREVIAHCLYGVDKNPLAVDLCRVALWIEGHTPGKPLTFLDHRIRCGDSLLGVFDLSVLKSGIPDEAFKALEGDDKAAAKEALRRNRAERDSRQRGLPFDTALSLQGFSRAALGVTAIPDDTPDAIRAKKAAYERAHTDPGWFRQKQACDLWTAAFFQSFRGGEPVIASGSVADRLAGRGVQARLQGAAAVLSGREHFFHWPLEFPEVFAEGGFDAVLSNPPWERIKLQEQEFFAARDASIATAPTKAARSRLIQDLPRTNPELYAAYQEALHAAEAGSQFLRHSGRFPLAGRGDINTYAVFAELARALVNSGGRAGIIVPTGIATDDTTKVFFQEISASGALASLYDFENRKKIFPAIDSRIKFCLLTQRGPGGAGAAPEFVFFALEPADLRRPEKRFTLTAEEIALLNPNTGNCPIFRSRADAELTKAIYRRVPVLWREAKENRPAQNPWRLTFKTMFHMANDSHLFKTAAELTGHGYRLEGNVFVGPSSRYLPLYEAKMIHQFDHRWATYGEDTETRDVTEEEKADPSFVVQPRYWVEEREVFLRSAALPRGLLEALRARDRTATVLCLGHLLFARWLGQLYSSPEEAWANLFPAWRAFVEAFPFARRLAPTQLGLCADNPPSLRPQGGHYLPAAEIDAIAYGPREATAWYEAEKLSVAALLDLPREYPALPGVLPALESEGAALAFAETLLEAATPKWFLGWRDICRSTDERTLIASVIPRAGVGNNCPILLATLLSVKEQLCLQCIANSIVVDFVARQKIGGTHINYFYFKQFPFFSASTLACPTPFSREPKGLLASCDAKSIGCFLFPRSIEISYTSTDMDALAHEIGFRSLPFRFDSTRRFDLRCELDAFFFHLYLPADGKGRWGPARIADGHVVDETDRELAALQAHFPTPRDAVAYILEQFPIVKRKDEARFGRFRTKERILGFYDAMQEAQAAGKPYRSPLDPPPEGRP